MEAFPCQQANTSSAGSDPARRSHEDGAIARTPDFHAPWRCQAPGESSMPVSVADADEFARTLVELGIVDNGELASLVDASGGGIPGLARALIAAGKLTQYQAAAIYQKKTAGS